MRWLFFKLLKYKDYFYGCCHSDYFKRDVCLHNISADALLNTHGKHG